MNSVIYNPLEEYDNKFQKIHLESTNTFFEKLVKQSGVDIEENRKTVKKYNEFRENLAKLKRKRNLLRVLRVFMIITLILIPFVILKITPKIRDLKSEIEIADSKADELLELAHSQMAPLNRLFTDRDALNLIESTVPSLKFEPCFSVKQELDMKTNFDFAEQNQSEQSTLEVLAGNYNENPFLFENKFVHTLGMETYHGSKTIYWTETYVDSKGRVQTRTRSETLHASVTKPKPFYSTQVVLNYGAQGAPELSFSRDASYLDEKSDRALERHIKKGEKKLKRKTDKAIKQNDDFVSMSNSEFEVLFDALDRTNEVQYRTLFTPLAQTNMVDLILSKKNYGDDFNFLKTNRMNKIISGHSQGRAINLLSNNYFSYSFDIIKSNFVNKNQDFFKAVYFDFAPLWAIPAYQERPVHSLKPIPDYSQIYSQKECEALANTVDYKYLVHPNTKTKAILKSNYISSKNNIDEICITAHSYDIIPRVDVVSVFGGDGRFHNVSVPWEEYISLATSNNFYVSDLNTAQNNNIISSKNGLCIFS